MHKKTKGILAELRIKIGCPVKIASNIDKKVFLVNVTFGYGCDVDQEKDIIFCVFGKKVCDITSNSFGKNQRIYKKAEPIIKTLNS